ncbi:MAG: DUF1549 and DUF1553 domain-containing protein, partial [Lentisphaeraceae bacterium]|nr:DUF1549 and DUF1553 domain-containing protein [Lentisphaeraceae bacterium]
HSLTPSSEASKQILVKRAYYALTGLPPTFEEMQKFLNDKSPTAYESLIDELLSRKSYGEKWGRHWLDLVRFADTQGFLPGARNTKYPFSYTFRDFVIRSFNEDKPYNEFIMQHLAADKMELKDKRDLAGLGFLTTGERFLNKRDEIINDQIDVTTQGFLAMTVACSRCHDHKFDPIPTADYYSMYGIFDSIQEPQLDELPVIEDSKDPELFNKYTNELQRLEKKLSDIEQGFRVKIEKEWQKVAQDYVEYIFKQTSGTKGLAKIDSMGNQFRKRLILDFKASMFKDRQNPVYRLLMKVATKKATFEEAVKQELSYKKYNDNVNKLLVEKSPKTEKEFIKLYKDLIVKAQNEKESYPEIHEVFFGATIKNLLVKNDIKRYISNAEDNAYLKAKSAIKSHYSTPGAPSRAMIVEDKAKPTNPRIFVRGKKDVRGDAVPRRFLQVISTNKEHEKFTEGSGRLELAKAIADEKNPLTARVIVNRVWQWHFGTGIVNTPSNFGLLGSRPTHPQLLDYLADYFMKNDWSFKKLNKLIMTSAVYRQQSVNRRDMASIDGANTYLWKMNNRRLTWEELRDSLVARTGQLKDFSGPPVEMLKGKYQPFRTVYGFVDRNKVQAAYKSFDFPSALVTCEMRSTTIVPQQGLFLLNSNFMMKTSQMVSNNIKGTNDEEKITDLFKKVYSREPTESEVKFSKEFLAEASETFKEKAVPEWIFGYATLTDGKMLEDFVQFKFFNKSRWQVSKNFPDREIGHAMLSSKGGHPGKTKAVVRRCKIHKSGTLSIKGTLKHKNTNGNGVRVLILHNGSLMGEWDCKTKTISTTCENIEVQAGDYIDLVVDSKANPTSDSFEWPLDMQLKANSEVEEFSTVDSFFDKKTVKEFSPWDGLAQVLMISNEFLYVD